MNVEMNLRDADGSSVEFSDEVDGPILQFAGNGNCIAIRLDDDHLPLIIDQLAEWGWVSHGTEEDPS